MFDAANSAVIKSKIFWRFLSERLTILNGNPIAEVGTIDFRGPSEAKGLVFVRTYNLFGLDKLTV